MKRVSILFGIVAMGLGSLLGRTAIGQEAPAPGAVARASVAPSQVTNDVRKAINWKQSEYTCEGGAKLTVYLHVQTVKVKYLDTVYVMKHTPSADGGRYSNGKVVWWEKGNGGFLQEDTANGKMIAKGCQLENVANVAEGKVAGTVSYLQKMALPPQAVILVELRDMTGEPKLIAEENITLGGRQVPVPFELKVDPAKIQAEHRYAVSAKIIVAGDLKFDTEKPCPVLTGGNPSYVEVMVRQVGAGGKTRP